VTDLAYYFYALLILEATIKSEGNWNAVFDLLYRLSLPFVLRWLAIMIELLSSGSITELLEL
jgi:hypothetical protein